MQTLLHQGPTLGLSAYPLIEIERFPSLYDRSQLNVKISNIANPFRSFVGVISPRALSEKIRDIIFSTFFRKNGTHSKKTARRKSCCF